MQLWRQLPGGAVEGAPAIGDVRYAALPGPTGGLLARPLWLGLQRRGGGWQACASPDGRRWWTAGVSRSFGRPLEIVGLFATAHMARPGSLLVKCDSVNFAIREAIQMHAQGLADDAETNEKALRVAHPEA